MPAAAGAGGRRGTAQPPRRRPALQRRQTGTLAGERGPRATGVAWGVGSGHPFHLGEIRVEKTNPNASQSKKMQSWCFRHPELLPAAVLVHVLRSKGDDALDLKGEGAGAQV